ncbi:hypothetical protein, partial [uncultured Thiodictyon sp.]|uniref:hypothetical protein n=1 Tax=uncultured Thiodictyon sp. TaxID=1846217 RepID=UPI0025F00489
DNDNDNDARSVRRSGRCRVRIAYPAPEVAAARWVCDAALIGVPVDPPLLESKASALVLPIQG